MLLDWTGEFDDWLDRMTERATAGDAHARAQLVRVNAGLKFLTGLDGEPAAETPTLRRVRQSGRFPVWRVGHPYTPGVAVRLVVWFPPDRPGEVVVVLFGADKARMGDVFYERVGRRADLAIEQYLRAVEQEERAQRDSEGDNHE